VEPGLEASVKSKPLYDANIMQIEPIDIRNGVNVEVSFSKATLASSTRFDALIVTVSGSTGIGCSSNADVSYIEFMTRAALGLICPTSLVFDFRDFEYEWGDGMARTLSAGEDLYVDDDLPVAVVVSDLCRNGLTSLIRDELFSDPGAWLFDSLESALAALEARVESKRQAPPSP
jgi:hypothetical protein